MVSSMRKVGVQVYEVLKEKRKDIFISNSLFEIVDSMNLKNGNHILFSYTYLFLVVWIYQEINVVKLYEKTEMSLKSILNTLCGVSANSKVFRYITKKDGLMDEKFASQTILRDEIPVSFFISEKNEKKYITYDEYYSDIDLDIDCFDIPKRMEFKKPIFTMDGDTFLTTETFSIDTEYYFKIIQRNKLDYNYFGMFIFIYYSCNYFGESYLSIETISNRLLLSNKTTIKYLKKLEEIGIITITENDGYRTGIANSYKINEIKSRRNKK